MTTVSNSGPSGCTDHKQSGSIIECENRVLGEEIPITGTPFALTYRSDRTPASSLTVDVPITDGREMGPAPTPIAPPGRIEVTLTVAGQQHRLTRTPPYALWDHIEWTWDRRDAFNRPVEGAQAGTVRVRYVYAAGFSRTVNFADYGGSILDGSIENREFYFDREYSVTFGSRDAKPPAGARVRSGWEAVLHVQRSGAEPQGQRHARDDRRGR